MQRFGWRVAVFVRPEGSPGSVEVESSMDGLGHGGEAKRLEVLMEGTDVKDIQIRVFFIIRRKLGKRRRGNAYHQ